MVVSTSFGATLAAGLNKMVTGTELTPEIGPGQVSQSIHGLRGMVRVQQHWK